MGIKIKRQKKSTQNRKSSLRFRAVEVLLGIFKPSFMLSNYLLGVTLLNMTFIILTIVKAYYIVAVFMHLGHEKKSLQISIVAPMWLLIPYLLFILLSEASFHGAIG